MTLEKFMIQFSKMDLKQKMETTSKMNKQVPTNASASQMRTIKAVEAWCTMNIMVGDDLCEPTIKSLRTFLKVQ
jgi:hypothetical protein